MGVRQASHGCGAWQGAVVPRVAGVAGNPERHGCRRGNGRAGRGVLARGRSQCRQPGARPQLAQGAPVKYHGCRCCTGRVSDGLRCNSTYAIFGVRGVKWVAGGDKWCPSSHHSCTLVDWNSCVQCARHVQALICTALGLPPTFFRRLVQSNGATSVLDFMPARGGGAPTLVVDRINQVQP